MRIFHIASRADWQRARDEGRYATSTRGRTLEQEGFIHAAHREQVPGVFREHYRGVREPLVLLTIDTDRLTEADVPWREEQVGDQRFPHVFGPLPVQAVVDVTPLDRHGSTPSFMMLFLGEVGRRMILAVVVMVASLVGMLVGAAYDETRGPGIGALVGLAVGALAVWLLVRLRRR